MKNIVNKSVQGDLVYKNFSKLPKIRNEKQFSECKLYTNIKNKQKLNIILIFKKH